jgi:TRAP-type C4-dicarboxylate transport system substrate-binding protein
MKKLIYALVVSFMICGLIFGGAANSTAKTLTFKAVAFSPVNNAIVAGFRIFVKKINAKFGNSIKIELVGGPEVIPPFQLHGAVKKGVIDMCLTSCGYYPSLVWEAQSAMFTNKNYKEIARTDYFKIMSNLHNKVGLIWLGAGTFHMPFYLYINNKLKTTRDFTGKKIRVFPPFIPFMKTLHAVPINLPMGDIYTAMERGAVDGFVMVNFGFVSDFSWNEVTKYVIDYPLYQGTAVILANSKKWKQLPANVQKEIIAFKKSDIDPIINDYYKKLGDKEWKLMIDKGVKTIKFSKSEGKAFLKMAYDSAWERVISKSPNLGPKLKEMLVK